MIFQEPSRSFDPITSIGKTFQETLRVKDPELSAGECQGRAVRLLSEVHIPRAEERLKGFPHQFSGGMLQRIMIALALANDPELLIADEPTTALDVTIQAEIVGLLNELRTRRRLSLVFISHNLALVGQIADRILVMYAGLVLEAGPAARRSLPAAQPLHARAPGRPSVVGEPLQPGEAAHDPGVGAGPDAPSSRAARSRRAARWRWTAVARAFRPWCATREAGAAASDAGGLARRCLSLHLSRGEDMSVEPPTPSSG